MLPTATRIAWTATMSTEPICYAMLADTKGSDCTDGMRIDEMFARGVILRDRQMRNAMVQAPSKVE